MKDKFADMKEKWKQRNDDATPHEFDMDDEDLDFFMWRAFGQLVYQMVIWKNSLFKINSLSNTNYTF